MRKPPYPEPDNEAATDFLENFHPIGPWHIATMPPDGRLSSTTVLNTRLDSLEETIAEHNGEDNIYFHVNTLRPGVQNTKAKKEDVVEIVALHVDVDDVTALERIQAFQPRPTVIVSSGGGYQAFWLLAHPSKELERAEARNIGLAQVLGGDNCHNIDRIMRVPGTINLPNAKKRAAGRVPALAHVVEADWSRRCSLDDFPEPTKPAPAGPKGAVARTATVLLINTEELPQAVSAYTRSIIETGDDPDLPRDCATPRYRTRSEAVFRVACDLARAGCSEEIIAGVLANPAYAIAQSVLEKKAPTRYALRQARAAIAAVASGWPDADRSGRPIATLRNTIVALQRLDLSFAHDLFRHRKVVNGNVLNEHQGEISDDACAVLRGLVLDTFSFDPRAENVRDAVTHLCLEHTFHPIRQMLDSLTWDGIPRLDRWLTTYFGATKTELNAATGTIMLIAAVRRVRQPGVKFDTIVVLEGRQGTGKSTALQILAGEGNHSDNEILTLDTKAQMEAMEGVWIYELGEISGLGKAEIERTKAFASRQVDKARMSYGRFSEARRRQTIFIGTTNDDKYLRDRTGNRRFLPVKTEEIDLNALRRDRDQLWAEAAIREANGESITLPEALWSAAAMEQEERLEDDPWMERLAMVQGRAYGDEVRVLTADLLGEALGIPVERQNNGHTKRLAALMRSAGWQHAKFKIGRKTIRGFRRPKPEGHVDDKSPIGAFESF